MDELIVQVLQGDAPAEVVESVRAWREASPENEARYRRTERLWSLTEPARTPAAPPDVAGIMAEAERRRASESGPSLARRDTRGRQRTLWAPARWALPLAAAIAAVAIGIRMDPLGLRTPTVDYRANGPQPRVVTLADGSLVKLAPGSTLRVADSDGRRGGTLEGRAFFAVSHDSDRPFVVRSGETTVRVLGTRFEVASSDDGIRTVVVDGRVAVSNERGSVEVPAGSVARTPNDGPPVSERVDDTLALLDWPTGVLLFQATPLAQVAAEVGRRFGQQVEVRGDRLRALRISGMFEEERFDEVILALCQAAGAECALTEDGARIGPAEGP